MNHSIKPACRNPADDACDAADRRFEQNVTTLVARGPRGVAELLRHLGTTTLCTTEIEQTTARFAALDPDLLRLVCADQFSPHPDLRLVRGRHAPR
jgi:hypothetical protein